MSDIWRFHIDTNDDNTADAVVLGHIGLALTGEYTATTQEQRDILTDLRKRHAVLVPATELWQLRTTT